MSDARARGVLAVFADHPVACNLLMAMMILAGLWSLTRLNTQFWPSLDLDFATVAVAWSGATAEDVERLITTPLEQELADLDDVKEMTSVSTDGLAILFLSFDEGTDMGLAVDRLKEKVGLVRNLPSTAETPEINRVVNYERIARLVVTGRATMRELRALAHRFKRELLERGISRVELVGVPKEEIAIEIPAETQKTLGLSLAEIGRRVAAASVDAPVGLIGRDEVARQLRFVDQRRNSLEFGDLPILVNAKGQRVTVGDVATVVRRPRADQTTVTFAGRPAVELKLERAASSDSLASARILGEWLGQTRANLPPGVEIHVYRETWKLIKSRIDLLLKNGASGLVLVILILFLFLNARIAFWVTVGIPTSFLATLGVLYLIGGSINMISLFGLIMAFGIIVDDAIVVGEDAETHFRGGATPLRAAESGARRMLAPVIASSLTTIAAFLPLALVGGVIGTIMSTIPIVVICVIAASLIESFLVLPGHMRGSFAHMRRAAAARLRRVRGSRFEWFRERAFRRVADLCVEFRWTTIAATLLCMSITLGWFAAGRVSFTFFPVPESTVVSARVAFVSGTPEEEMVAYLSHVERALYEVEEGFGEDLVVVAVVRHGTETVVRRDDAGGKSGTVFVELVEPDRRATRNRDILAAWRAALRPAAGIENLSIAEARVGPPGQDIELQITGFDLGNVKAAAEDLKRLLGSVPGVSGIKDNLPFGREQLVLKLTPVAESLGLSVQEVSRQLRAAYDGYLVQILADGDDEVEVRVVLPDDERNRLDSLDTFDIVLPGGNVAPVNNLVEIETRRGFDSVRHADGKLAVTVTGDVDPALANANRILNDFRANNMRELSKRYGVQFSLEGRQADQEETLTDMSQGAALALILIYLVLAWVFGSYSLPLVVMSIIPFGVIGAFWGHVLLDLELTVLSLFGFFGLAGIVVNDSIILVAFYKRLKEQGVALRQAVVDAACQRLRAVLLTSLTTIGGLTPLLFETSLQAQFLIPMAASIAFGLAFSTLLVLLLVPCLLYVHERVAEAFSRADAEVREQAPA